MADERIVTSIVANSDFSNLIADVQRVSSSLFKLQQEFAGANRALAGQIDAANAMFNQNMLKTGQFSSHFVSLTSDVEKFGKNLDGGRLKLKDYFRVYQENVRTSGGLIRDLAKQQVQLQNAVLQPLGKNAQGLMQYNVHIPRGLDLTKNKTALLKQELQIMNKVIQDGGVQLINWGKNTQWAGRQLTVGLTLPLVAFGKAAADAFKVADQELTRLTKVYGDVAGTSAQELAKVRKEVSATAKELSAAMGVNFSETIGLAADIAATGKTGNELLSSVSETTRLAVLGEVDRQEAMKATLAIQSAFKSNTQELAETINFLNAVENQTSTTLNDLVEAIPKAGPVIKGLGGDVQDLALYMTAMREGGINASEGANALKSALASLINPTDVAVKKFQGFGIDLLGIVNKNAGDTTATLFALQAALDRLDPLQKQQAIEQLFGKFQFSRLNALFENLGRQGSQTLQVLDLMKASAGELEAVAGRELAAVTESAAGRYKRAVETLKAELASTGDSFLNIATKLVNVLNKVLEFGSKLPDPIKKLMTFAGAFTAIIGPVIMLTGVLANFFGYIIKGLGHFKALFKGAEGFKLLTPEIIAARNASSMLSDEFYSDAKAADTLSLAIKRLSEDLKGLQVNASNATSTTNTLGATIATAAGTPIMTVGGALGAPRVTDPNHPLVGPETRAAAHLNPRDPNNPSSIFGLTLQPVPVNRKIGATPQILMSERLPDIPGLTTVSGVSTGVVAAEHAKFAALMATLGVQSQQEIDALKKTIGLGGQVSRELLDTFDDILPITQRLTANAAAQSASIVAELRAGTINVQQARAQIIAVNAQLEAMMGAEVSAYAAARGRTIDLTKAPLINQPVVDIAGKPNIRGAYRSGIFLDVMESLGRATGTKSFGGPYSIETTRPIQRNRGGSVPGYINGEYVYMTNGETVPGPNVNADVVPAMLTPGEFVLTRDVVEQQGSDAVEALHRGQAAIVPFGANMGGKVPGYNFGKFVTRVLSSKPKLSAGSITGSPKDIFPLFGVSRKGKFTDTGSFVGPRGGEIISVSAKPATAVYGAALSRMPINPDTGKPHTLQSLNGAMARRGLKGEELDAYLATLGYMSQGGPLIGTTTQFLNAINIDPKLRAQILQEIDADFYKHMGNLKRSGGVLTDSTNPYHNISNNVLNKYFGTDSLEKYYWNQFKVQTSGLNPLYVSDLKRGAGHSSSAGVRNIFLTSPDGKIIRVGKVKGSGKHEMAFHAANPDWEDKYGFGLEKVVGLNQGGRVPGYQNGGGVSRAGLLAKLGAKFKYEGKTFDGPQSLKTYKINAMDIQGGKKYFSHIPGLSDKARGALYDATLDYFNTSKITGPKIDGKRMFNPTSMLTAFPTIAQFAVTSNRSWLPESDLAILQSFANKGASLGGTVGSSVSGMAKVYGKLFGANNGGMVPGYNRGGRISRNPNRAGGTVRSGRRFYGDFSRTPFGMMQSGAIPYPGGAPATGSRLQVSPVAQSPSMLGMMGFQAASFGGMYAGQSLGSRFGSGGAMAGSVIGSILPMMMMGGMGKGKDISALYDKSILSGTKFGQSMAGQAMQGGKLSSTLGRLALGLTKFNVALAGIATAIGVGAFLFRRYQEAQDRVANSFGMTAEQAKKAGLNYTNLSSKIKESIESAKALQERNQLVYQSLTMANTPLKLTIEQYKKLKQQVKDTMPDVVENINKMNRVEAKDYAVQLKTQFMAYGDTVEEATKKIYALFAVSDKKFMAGAVIAQKAFGDIKTSADAAASSINLYNKSVDVANSKGQARAVDTALQAIDTAIQNTLKSSKDQITYYDAMKKTLDEINLKTSKQVNLTKETIRGIAAQNPELASVLNTTDTIVSAWSKYQLLLKGINLDLSVLNANQAIAVNNAVQLVSQNVAASLIDTKGILRDENKLLKEKEAQYKKLETAAKGQSVKEQIDARERLKALDKEIKKINDKAEARKKALREEAQAEDISLRIQQQKLQYEKAVSAGDFGGAAEAQIELTRLQNEQQVTLTEQQIEERRLKDIAPLEREKERLSREQEKLADAAALAGESMQTLAKQIANLKTTIADVTNSIFSIVLGRMFDPNFENTPAGKAAYAALSKLLKDTGNVPAGLESPESPSLDTSKGSPGASEVTTYQDQANKISPTALGQQMYDAVAKGIEKGLTNNPLVVKAQNVVIETGALAQSENKMGRSDLERILTQQGNSPEYTKKQLESKSLDPQVIASIIKYLKLDAKETFQYNGIIYNVERGHNAFLGPKGSIKKAMGGHIKGFEPGGPVSGPGTSTSDSIPAYLSDGEYVVRAAAVDHYGVDTLEAINAKKLKDGGMVKPTLGTPDPNQSFINKLLFGTKYIGGNMTRLKGEMPWGPGSVGKAAASFATKFKDFDIKFTPGTVPSADSVVGYFNNAPVLLKNYFDTIKSGAKWPNLTEHPAYEAGGSLNALRAYIAGSNKPVGELSWDPFSGTVLSLNVDSAFRRKGLASKFWEIASGLGPISHSAVRSLEGDDWARAVGGNLPDLQHLVPKMAGGGYVNPAYSANMSMPSYYTGAKYVYDDTIAKLHKGEMVVPSGMNPNNPFATNAAGGISINMPLTVNAAPGMDEDYLINKAAIKVQKAMETALTKVGTERNITRRYQ